MAGPYSGVVTASNGVVSFNWSAVSNQIYQLQYAPTLMAPVWTDLGSPVTATSNTATTGPSDTFWLDARSADAAISSVTGGALPFSGPRRQRDEENLTV